jgi:hypothetical protein
MTEDIAVIRIDNLIDVREAHARFLG